jgi:hypothetical protein
LISVLAFLLRLIVGARGNPLEHFFLVSSKHLAKLRLGRLDQGSVALGWFAIRVAPDSVRL